DNFETRHPTRLAGRLLSAASAHDLRLEALELGVVDHTLGLQVRETGELVGRTATRADCALDVLARRRVARRRVLSRVLAHLVPSCDQVHEDAEIRKDD